MTARARSEHAAAKPHYEGHRQRLRARFLEAGEEALQDYEILEMLLFAAIPRRDVKPLAKKLLAEGNGLWGVLTASPARLESWGLSESVAALLRAIAIAGLRAQKGVLIDQPILSSWQRILDYCRAAMGRESKEQFRLLFLDRKNRLIKDEVQQRGTVDHAPVYPREVVQRALEVGAGSLVLVHNHPSGDVMPSQDDIDMTRAIVEACRPLGIVIHDHIIIGANDVGSFKGLGLL